MFKYLFKKQVKSDQDYQRYHVIWFSLSSLFVLVVVALFAKLDLATAIGGAVDGGIPLIIYAIWLHKISKQPKRLRQERLRVTDERRKLLDQEIWAQIGRALTVLLGIVMYAAMFASFFAKAETRGVYEIELLVSLGVFVLIILYYYVRLRK
ncbi:MAG: hypothetical protein LBS41_01125 [Streptococcaceae bacterium]|jgi:uncharacterized membrane-anchored protein|nr:hypothetical protein [Streptococcaceae bacterium]